jgi:1,4-dihydroxy-2-naphthoate octaprenyltransferase
MWRYLVWSLRLRRVEYRIAELPIFLIPTLLTIPDATAFLGAPFWEGLLVFFFLFAFGDLLNCLADRELDALYKPHLTEAVYGIGVGGVVLQAVLSAVAAVALTVHLAWLLGRWLLVPLVLVGLFIALAYSVEPFRLKGRGLWQLAFYWLGLFTGPMAFTALLFQPWPAPGVWGVAVCYGLTQTGVILVNAAEDYPEDRHMGVRTAIVALGLARGIGLALGLMVVGWVGLLGSYALLSHEGGLPLLSRIGLVPLVLAGVAVYWALWTLHRQVIKAPDAEAINAVKRAARWVPLWITALALASLLTAAVWFLAK